MKQTFIKKLLEMLQNNSTANIIITEQIEINLSFLIKRILGMVQNNETININVHLKHQR